MTGRSLWLNRGTGPDPASRGKPPPWTKRTTERSNMQKLFRHGDVILVPVSNVPDGTKAVRRKRGKLVLAEGEVTGHAHVIDADEVKLVTSEEAEELRTWLLVESPAAVPLTHEEHATILVPPGSYEVRIAREYSPEAIRRVVD